MLHERKKYNYLSIQQRTLNSSNVTDNQKYQHKNNSILTSNTKSQQTKQPPITTQPYTSFSRNSSAKKPIQPLSEISQNFIFSDIKNSANKKLPISNKQNISLGLSRQSFKDQKNILVNSSISNDSILATKIKQLQKQNSMILKQTQEKYILMEKHLQKVESILKQKEATIETLTNQTIQMTSQKLNLSNENTKLKDEKQELLKIIATKNEETKKYKIYKEQYSLKQAQLMSKIDFLNKQIQNLKVSTIKCVENIFTQTQQCPVKILTKQFSVVQCQTEINGYYLEELIRKNQLVQQTEKINYRQKYEGLFKKALQMQDEIYKLKEELFDSQNQVKTLQQEFNTYKIFNQIEKINQKN